MELTTRQPAILIVGPTGAGKTPLGDWLQDHGLWGRPCHHFDFGSTLRAVAAGKANGFTPAEIAFIRELVESGSLLENETFHLALRMLAQFIACRRVMFGDLLIMNGLPRHIGQAEALADLLQFRAIIQLQCSAKIVRERLQGDAGGDRTGRTDDSVTLVERKLTVFAERTRPLLTWYQQKGVPLIPIAVDAETRPPDILPLLEGTKF